MFAYNQEISQQADLNNLVTQMGKESVCHAGDPGLIPELGRWPREWNGNPVQYSFLENSMDRGGWRAVVHGVVKSQI